MVRVLIVVLLAAFNVSVLCICVDSNRTGLTNVSGMDFKNNLCLHDCQFFSLFLSLYPSISPEGFRNQKVKRCLSF